MRKLEPEVTDCVLFGSDSKQPAQNPASDGAPSRFAE